MHLCSECTARVKPVVAVDVDGTISEYHHSLADHVWRYFGIEDVRVDSWDGSGNYEDFLGVTQAQYREAKLAYRQGGFKRWSPVMDGTESLLAALTWLRERELIEVWITTTRPWLRLDSVDPDTRFWLDAHFPVYDHVLYDDNKYHRLSGLIDATRVIGVIDDLPEQVNAAKLFVGAPAYLVPRQHNRLVHPSMQRATLEQFAAIVENNAHEWWSK